MLLTQNFDIPAALPSGSPPENLFESNVDRTIDALKVARALPSILAQELRGAGYREMQERHVEILLELGNDSFCMAELIRRGRFDQAEIEPQVNSLVEQNYIRRVFAKSSRTEKLEITKLGKQALRTLSTVLHNTEHCPLLWLMA